MELVNICLEEITPSLPAQRTCRSHKFSLLTKVFPQSHRKRRGETWARQNHHSRYITNWKSVHWDVLNGFLSKMREHGVWFQRGLSWAHFYSIFSVIGWVMEEGTCLLNLQKTLRATCLRIGLESRMILANWSNGLKNTGQCSKTTIEFTLQK